MRTESGLSQEALASVAGIDRVYLSGLERGLHSPSLDTLVRLAEAFGVNPSELVVRMEARRPRRRSRRRTGGTMTVPEESLKQAPAQDLTASIRAMAEADDRITAAICDAVASIVRGMQKRQEEIAALRRSNSMAWPCERSGLHAPSPRDGRWRARSKPIPPQ